MRINRRRFRESQTQLRPCKEFEFEEVDSDFESRDCTCGWICYAPTANVAEDSYYHLERVAASGKWKLVKGDELTENLSGIEISFDADIHWDYDSGTYIPGDGGPGGWYEKPGYYVDSVDVDTDYVFVYEDEEITIEQFAEINQVSVEQAKAMAEYCQRLAEEWLEDCLRDNPPDYN